MGPLGSGRIAYADALAAIGRWIQSKHMTDVCIMEFESGLIVTGTVVFTAGDALRRRVDTQVFSEQDILQLVRGKNAAALPK